MSELLPKFIFWCLLLGQNRYEVLGNKFVFCYRTEYYVRQLLGVPCQSLYSMICNVFVMSVVSVHFVHISEVKLLLHRCGIVELLSLLGLRQRERCQSSWRVNAASRMSSGDTRWNQSSCRCWRSYLTKKSLQRKLASCFLISLFDSHLTINYHSQFLFYRLCSLELLYVVYGLSEFPSVLWRCWLGGRKGIQPVKKLWVVG